jgi:CBS-domain-containing membrane protein
MAALTIPPRLSSSEWEGEEVPSYRVWFINEIPHTTLAEVMDPASMPPGKMAIEALRLMEDGRYRHLPIVEGNRVVGIVSRFDFSGIELDWLDEKTGL